MNADEERAMEKAREAGKGHFFVTRSQGEEWVKLAPRQRLNSFSNSWLVDPQVEKALLQFLNKNKEKELPATRTVAITLLQSPEYQLSWF